MRVTLSAAVLSALALSACSAAKDETAAEAPAAPATATAPVAHDMAAMDAAMKSADAADDTQTAETPDGFMFHTAPGKVESVHLPAGVWKAAASDADIITVGEASDMTMPDGKVHHVVKVTPKASGNASVKFDGPAGQSRTVQFMVH